MKIPAILGAGLLACALTVPGLAQDDKPIKDDLKDAGKATGHAVKKSGKKVKHATKKGVNKAADKTAEGAEKLSDKTK